MEFSKETLNSIYEFGMPLGDFIDTCASRAGNGAIFHASASDLSDDDIIKIVDFWKKKQAKQKYTVQVFGNVDGYLFELGGSFGLLDKEPILTIQKTQFTESEIEKLKQRDDLAIDWDKAIIEPVEAK